MTASNWFNFWSLKTAIENRLQQSVPQLVFAHMSKFLCLGKIKRSQHSLAGWLVIFRGLPLETRSPGELWVATAMCKGDPALANSVNSTASQKQSRYWPPNFVAEVPLKRLIYFIMSCGRHDLVGMAKICHSTGLACCTSTMCFNGFHHNN